MTSLEGTRDRDGLCFFLRLIMEVEGVNDLIIGEWQ